MKKNPSLVGFLIALVAVLLAFGAYFLWLKKENVYLVDNPTGKTFYFSMNGQAEQIIAAGQYVKVPLSQGKNAIRVLDEAKKPYFDTVFYIKGPRGLINITHSPYIINTQYYGYDVNKDSLLRALPAMELEGKTYFGGPRKFSGGYTEDFYYNVHEQYDQIVKNVQKTESRTKIFRKNDFINYYNAYYNQQRQ